MDESSYNYWFWARSLCAFAVTTRRTMKHHNSIFLCSSGKIYFTKFFFPDFVIIRNKYLFQQHLNRLIFISPLHKLFLLFINLHHLMSYYIISTDHRMGSALCLVWFKMNSWINWNSWISNNFETRKIHSWNWNQGLLLI